MLALVVTHDSDLTDYLAYLLRRAGLEVSFRGSPDVLVKNWGERPADLVILQVGEEDKTQKAIKELRRLSNTPILVLYSDVDEQEQANFLQAGADIILPLPIGPKLLLAYIQSLIKRSQSSATTLLPLIDLGKVALNPASRTVQVQDKPSQTLTQLEFRLLYLLMTHPGQVMPPDVIVDRVWGYGESGSKELVRGLVSRVRSKIEPNPGEPIFIHTLPGVGYLFEPGS